MLIIQDQCETTKTHEPHRLYLKDIVLKRIDYLINQDKDFVTNITNLNKLGPLLSIILEIYADKNPDAVYHFFQQITCTDLSSWIDYHAFERIFNILNEKDTDSLDKQYFAQLFNESIKNINPENVNAFLNLLYIDIIASQTILSAVDETSISNIIVALHPIN